MTTTTPPSGSSGTSAAASDTAEARLGRLAAALAERRRALLAGGGITIDDLLPLLRHALADRPIAGEPPRRALLLLAEELDQLATSLGEERGRVRDALAQLGQQARAHSAYAAQSRRWS